MKNKYIKIKLNNQDRDKRMREEEAGGKIEKVEEKKGMYNK